MDDSSVVVTMEDVKSATNKFGIKKWQGGGLCISTDQR